LLPAWFNGQDRVCIANVDKSRNVTAKMLDISERLDNLSEVYQRRLRLLHGLLSRLKVEIPKDKPAAHLLFPLNEHRDIAKRSWELYEMDLNEPFVASKMPETQFRYHVSYQAELGSEYVVVAPILYDRTRASMYVRRAGHGTTQIWTNWCALHVLAERETPMESQHGRHGRSHVTRSKGFCSDRVPLQLYNATSKFIKS
jgi:hypothetical protein